MCTVQILTSKHVSDIRGLNRPNYNMQFLKQFPLWIFIERIYTGLPVIELLHFVDLQNKKQRCKFQFQILYWITTTTTTTTGSTAQFEPCPLLSDF
jgi:hypothetical protein